MYSGRSARTSINPVRLFPVILLNDFLTSWKISLKLKLRSRPSEIPMLVCGGSIFQNSTQNDESIVFQDRSCPGGYLRTGSLNSQSGETRRTILATSGTTLRRQSNRRFPSTNRLAKLSPSV